MYLKLISLMGASIHSQKWIDFWESISATPELEEDNGVLIRFCSFKKGFEVSYDKGRDLIWSIHCYCGGADCFPDVYGSFERYAEDLPSGISFDDKRDDIRRKIGQPNQSSLDYRPVSVDADREELQSRQKCIESDIYELSPGIKLQCYFNSADNGRFFKVNIRRTATRA